MSYLSATENVGFSGIPQNISDGICATQYKLAAEGVPGNCSEVMYIQDNSTDDSSYITHLNDNYYTKFKIDPNELYTFHDSDVVAGEITVSHTEDTFVFSDSDDSKQIIENAQEELVLDHFTNGDIQESNKVFSKKVHSNGHYVSTTKPISKETKTSNTKVQKAKGPIKEARRQSLSDTRKQAPSPKSQVLTPNLNSINSIETNLTPSIQNKASAMETFLDVFKREQGLMKNEVKTEPSLPAPVKIPISPPKKLTAKTPSQVKARRGRGPTVHEALQRIPPKAIAMPNLVWHAPGDNLFDCGPLDSKIPAFKLLDSSSSDDDYMPDFESGSGPVSTEEYIPQSRGSRLALRRAALRRHVARAHRSLRLSHKHDNTRALATVIRKQLNSSSSPGSLPTQTVSHLLAMRGMSALLTSQERRALRLTGVTQTRGCGPWPERQRLFAAAAAACRLPHAPPPPHLLMTPAKPVKEKPRRPRRAASTPRRPRRRPPPARPPPPPPPPLTPSLPEMTVCSNSSYDSSEEAAMALSDTDYITAPHHQPLEVEVGNVPADDILDPGVLSQLSDETFTEFFNQGIVLAESGATFSESPELAAALEAVLERTLPDERGPTHIGQYGQPGQVGHDGQIGHVDQVSHNVQIGHVGQVEHDVQVGHVGQVEHDVQVGQVGQIDHVDQVVHVVQDEHDVQVGHVGHGGQVGRIGHGHVSRNIYIHSPQQTASDKIQAPPAISMEVSTIASS